MAPLFSAYVWLRENPVVLWIGGAFAAIMAFLSWQRLRDIRIRKEERLKQRAENLRQKERAVEYVETLEQELHDEAQQAIERRDDARPLDPERMSDAQRKRIFGRGAATGDSGKRR